MNALDQFIFQWCTPYWCALGSALLILAACFGCGKLLLRSYGKELTAFSCGTALFMVLFALLPANRLLLFGTTLPFALWGIWNLRSFVKAEKSQTLFALLIFLISLGSALLLPYSWDEQSYQVALPLRFLQNGSFAPCPDNPYSCYPALTSWFFANAVKLGGITVPRLLVSALSPILLLGVWKMCRPYGKWAISASAAALLFCPLFLAANRGVYVENFIALFTLGGIFAARELRKKGYPASVLCGLLAGAAFAVKPTGAVGSLLLFVLFALKVREWKKLLLFCGTAFVFSFFWYFRTFLYTGSFFYPYSFFPVPGSVEHFHHLLGSARYGLEGFTGIVLNWLFAGFDKKLFDGIVTGFHLPFLGAAAVAGALLWRRQHPRYSLLVLGSLAALLLPLLLWSAFFPQSRFLLPLIPPAAAAGSIVIARSRFRKTGFLILGVLLLCSLVFQAYQPLRHYFVSWKIQSAVRQSPGRALGFLARDPGLYTAFEFLGSSTPVNARCLLLMERRGLYCPRPYAIAFPGFEPSLTPVPETPEKMLEKLHAFDYIIVGQTTQDVDWQYVNNEACKKVFLLLGNLIETGKLKVLSNSGYLVLQVIKQGGKNEVR